MAEPGKKDEATRAKRRETTTCKSLSSVPHKDLQGKHQHPLNAVAMATQTSNQAFAVLRWEVQTVCSSAFVPTSDVSTVAAASSGVKAVFISPRHPCPPGSSAPAHEGARDCRRGRRCWEAREVGHSRSPSPTASLKDGELGGKRAQSAG